MWPIYTNAPEMKATKKKVVASKMTGFTAHSELRIPFSFKEEAKRAPNGTPEDAPVIKTNNLN